MTNETLKEYVDWLNSQLMGIDDKIWQAKVKRDYAKASYLEGMHDGLIRYTKKITNIKPQQYIQDIHLHLAYITEEIIDAKALRKTAIVHYLEGMNDALIHCLTKLKSS